MESKGISPGFSPRFRHIVDVAVAIARHNRSPVDDDYLLAGLLAEGDCAAARLLVAHGLSTDRVGARLPSNSLPDIGPNDHVPFTASAKLAVDRAIRKARRRGDYVSAEHLLFGLLANGGSAAALVSEEQADDGLVIELTALLNSPADN